MNPLIAKEIRLLWPAFAMALLLAIVPAWLLQFGPYISSFNDFAIVIYLFGFGVVMLALSSFGREFGFKTFPLLLAQPMERTRIWWTKVVLLAVALAIVFVAWCLSSATSAATSTFLFKMKGSDGLEALMIGATIAAVAFAGGLWTTLFLRQVVGAFWFTILIPGAILMIIEISGGTGAAMLVAMAVYSVAGFWLAWWQFSRVQEAGWTGGVINFPNWKTAGAAARPSLRSHRPLAALVGKELQLHQISLLGMGGLFVLHLGVVWLRKTSHLSNGDTMRMALEVFGGLWFIVPVLTGSLSVSEERKLGTIQELLCMPVSRHVQFAIKLLITLIVGGLLSSLLFWTAEGIGTMIGGGSGIFGAIPFEREALASLSLGFLGLALIGLYASTLTRGIVQALAAAIVTTIVTGLFIMIMVNKGGIGVHLWHGFLVNYIAWPTLIPAFVWLAWRNFRSVSTDWLLWRRNLLVWATTLAFIMVATAAIYNRVWELLTPLEPQHGPAQLVGPKPVAFHSYGGSALAAILPDGRLWGDRIAYDPGRLILSFAHEDRSQVWMHDNSTGFRVGGKWVSLSGNRIMDGSNWVDAVTTFRETIAIRADGTLWVSEKPRPHQNGNEDVHPSPDVPANLVRFGNGTDWQSVVAQHSLAMVLLKRDGTLWHWGTNSFNGKVEWPGLRAFEPYRLGTGSDWVNILKGLGPIYAWKKDGSAWSVHPPEKEITNQETVLEPQELVMTRVPVLDNAKWKSLTEYMNNLVGLREDGTLWLWNMAPRNGVNKGGTSPLKGMQIGNDTNWVGVAGQYRTLAALKADGSIWEWSFRDEDWYHGRASDLGFLPAQKSPVRLGTHTDWVAIGYSMGGIVSLAADGSLFFWWDRGWPENTDQPMLAPPRKSSKIENILAKEK